LSESCKKFKNGSCTYPEFCIKKFKQDKFFDLALISENQRIPLSLYLDSNACDKNSFDRLNEIKNSICDFVGSGNNIYIYSSTTGNGKTAWSLKLAQNYIGKIWYEKDLSCEVLFISVPRYLLSIKDAISNNNEYAKHIKENVLSANLVIWDDIATKGMTEFETENVLSIIDARISSGKSNIFTSNILPQELSLYVGDRLASRILGTSESIKFVGQDKRIMGRMNDGTVTSS
jgi:DNA replication protein DnaC